MCAMSLPFTRADALACFDEFLPKAGSFYAKTGISILGQAIMIMSHNYRQLLEGG